MYKPGAPSVQSLQDLGRYIEREFRAVSQELERLRPAYGALEWSGYPFTSAPDQPLGTTAVLIEAFDQVSESTVAHAEPYLRTVPDGTSHAIRIDERGLYHCYFQISAEIASGQEYIFGIGKNQTLTNVVCWRDVSNQTNADYFSAGGLVMCERGDWVGVLGRSNAGSGNAFIVGAAEFFVQKVGVWR